MADRFVCSCNKCNLSVLFNQVLIQIYKAIEELIHSIYQSASSAKFTWFFVCSTIICFHGIGLIKLFMVVNYIIVGAMVQNDVISKRTQKNSF
jgi:hypothetical protein